MAHGRVLRLYSSVSTKASAIPSPASWVAVAGKLQLSRSRVGYRFAPWRIIYFHPVHYLAYHATTTLQTPYNHATTQQPLCPVNTTLRNLYTTIYAVSMEYYTSITGVKQSQKLLKITSLWLYIYLDCRLVKPQRFFSNKIKDLSTPHQYKLSFF